jgi:hypothetical protein
MILLNCLNWWYGRGWSWQVQSLKAGVNRQLEYYSIGSLLSTLFAPYRQIGAEFTGRVLSSGFQAWVDRTISRIIGAVVRLLIISAGVLVVTFYALVRLIAIVLWPIVPLLPILGIILAVLGVGK